MAVLETDGTISIVPMGDTVRKVKRPSRFLKK